MGGVVEAIFGGGDDEREATQTVYQTRDIPPPSPEEKQLLTRLYDLSLQPYSPSNRILGLLQRSYTPSTTLTGLLANQYYTPSKEYEEVLKNPYLSMLPYQQKVGETLNLLANRGVVNSSVAQKALAQLGEALAEKGKEMRLATLAELEKAKIASEEDRLKRAMALEELTKAAEAYNIQKGLQEESLQKQAYDDQFNRAFQLFAQLYSGRMQSAPVSTVSTSVQPAPPGMFPQILGTGLGLGLAHWLGTGGGLSAIGSGISSLLGKIGGWLGSLFL